VSGGLFFDARYIKPVHDGISRFSANLFAAVQKLTPVTAIICDEQQLEKLPAGTRWIKLHKPTSPLEPLSSLLLNKHQPDLVFSPMQTIGSFGRKFKLVLTVHDLIYYRHPKPPGYLNPIIRFGWRLFHLSYAPERMLLAGCEAVATVSETTAADLRKHKLTKRPIGVVYNAPESIAAETKTRVTEKKLVYMGTFMPYKNVETLIRAVGLLPDFKLELLSKIDSDRKSELAKLAKALGAHVVFRNGVTDAEYQAALDSSTALVSASLDEGFGIPLVEAMSRAVPVIVSDIPIFREVAGEAGRYFSPLDPESLAASVRGLEQQPPAIEELQRQAARFNWDESANSLLNFIRQV
jgi:glycosyltransferase involved in cell wall biosynthesis